MIREANAIVVDIDKDRILEIVEHARDFMIEFTRCEFYRSKEAMMDELKLILNSNRVTTTFTIDFRNTYIEDFNLRIDIRRKNILGITGKFRKKKNKVNAFLRTL